MKYRIVGKQGQAVLVEWRDAQSILRRSTLPAPVLVPELDESDLVMGAPYGIEWNLSDATLRKLANRLHEQGIWTYADAADRIREFRSIVSEVIVASLLDAARGGR